MPPLGMTDDGIAIHGAFALVTAKLNATAVVLQTQGVYVPDLGDTFRLYDKGFVPAKSDYVVAGVAQMDREWRPQYNESKSLPRDGFHYPCAHILLMSSLALPCLFLVLGSF